jgi:DNA-binding winged helix-turn-helix (wHTH) protein
MVVTKQQFIPLLALPDPWAIRSGLPAETVLRRLTEWAMCAAFPEGAFRNARDVPVDPFDIYMSFRALSENEFFGSAVSLGSSTIFSPRWGIDVLRSVLISSSDIEAFCEQVEAEPPWQRYKTVWLFRREAARRQYLAPPPCPEAEAHAIRYDAGTSADASMNSMQSLLDSLLGKPKRRPFYSEDVDGGPIDFDFWGKRWANQREYALSNIEKSQNESLHGRLNMLTNLWEELLKSHGVDQKSARAETQVVATLRLCKSQRAVHLHGKEFPVPEKPFELLYLLSERSMKGKAVVPVREIELHLWGDQLPKMNRQVSDVVRELREVLGKGSGASGKELIRNRHGQGYLLELSPTEILLQP